VAGDRWEAEVVDERTRHIRSLTSGANAARPPATLRAPMPGLVVRVLVEAGQEVAAGAGMVVLEAMKMENELKAAGPSVVGAIRVVAGEPVEKGQVLVELRDRVPSP
jgi:pyruvate carboxylase subunit B